MWWGNSVGFKNTNICIKDCSNAFNSNYGFFCFIILYENPNLPLINTTIYVNEQKIWVPMEYSFNKHNKMDTLENIGLGLLTSSLCGVWDGYNIYIDNDSIGLIGGTDNNNHYYCTGTAAHFYHQNNTTYGLDDDTPDIWMDSTDALANIRPYITNPNQFGLDFIYNPGINPANNIQYQNFPEGLTNQPIAMVLAYKPDCDATILNVTYTDTTICKGESINLSATGGTRYIWEPSTFLNDSTIANPICTAERPIWYTCTMYTADSCSKTIPVFVDVNEPPTLANITTADTCGYTTGTITALAEGVLPLTYSLNGGTPQNNANFYNLDGSNYTLTVTDGNTCSTSESTVIENINITQALFTATPTIGIAPTEVEFINESTDATNYTWYITDSVYTSLNTNFTFADTGLYTITLVAYNNTPNCADTTYGSIQIVPPLYINIPNVITPNYDQVNDVFSIDIEGALAVNCQILNRWGTVLLTYNQDVTTQMQTLNIWDAVTTDNTIYTDGTYFYVINVISPTKIRQDYTGIIQVFGE
jgi:gliding motility-associated-like protein